MRPLLLSILLFALLAFSGCYMSEDASDVNQDRISTTYCTVFNASRDYTKSLISFKFGNTPLRVSNYSYFLDNRLFETKDIILGLHYSREIDGINDGSYEWTDETGKVYLNQVKAYSFDLIDPPSELKKYQYYMLGWDGAEIPEQAGDFHISIESHVAGISEIFYVGERLELESSHLDNMPAGRATMTISRNYSEPIDERTQAGGESTVSFVREFEITIVE
ncbi:MAG: hypothetical protein GY816_02945 [Cytophagales bacterium]|nr:hypothetical protein [Cytophagales bacterium]